MNIGIDVDGVLNNLQAYQEMNAVSFFQKKYGKPVVDPFAYEIQDMFNCGVEERQGFWRRYIWKYCLLEKPRSKAAETVCKWLCEGHELYIITSRVYTTDDTFLGSLFRQMLKGWLRVWRIPYSRIKYCSEQKAADEKVEACRKHNISVMLEDKTENILAISKDIPVICFDALYNKTCVGPNMYRVHSFEEADRVIQELSRLDLEGE